MRDLGGRVVVVTGGASGIGRGIAEAFAAAGSRLVLADVHEARLEETSRALRMGGDLVAKRCDVRRPEDVDALADAAYRAFGAVHVLCCNAGVACNGLVWEHPPGDWDWMLDTNVRGTGHCLRSFVPRLLDQGDPSHVVITSSMLGLASAPLTGLYGASKQAVLGIAEALRLDLGLLDARIGVSVLCPGPVRTNVALEPGRPAAPSGAAPEIVSRVAAGLRQVVADGMDPREVGDRVVEAVRAGRFWIFPAPGYLDNAEKRLAEIRAAVGAAPGSDPSG